MLEPLLPDRSVARRGGQWLDHRQVINGVLWRTRTGSPWRDLPGEFGNWKTVYMRHRRWSMDGTWERVLDELHRDCDRAEDTTDRRGGFPYRAGTPARGRSAPRAPAALPHTGDSVKRTSRS